MPLPPRFWADTVTRMKSASVGVGGRSIVSEVRVLSASVWPTQFALGAVAVAAPAPAVSITPEAVATPACV